VLAIDRLAVAPGEVLAVIGPNGAGKSTLLLALALLLVPDRGRVRFRGRPADADGALTHRRRIGLVLQDPLLLDTTVFDNVAAGLRFRGLPRAEIAARVGEWLARLGIAALARRPARALSGGEAQRVSLARAFALRPEVLLLDEAFNALDAPTRARLLDDLQGLLAATGVTTVFVTHERDEALLLGHRVAVLLAGRLRQVGPPEQVFGAPADEEVAAFVGVETVVPGRVAAAHEGRIVVEADGLAIEAVGTLAVGRRVLVCLRPEHVTLWAGAAAPASSARNALGGRVERLRPQGGLLRVEVDCGVPIVALITRASALDMDLAAGRTVTVTFKASAVHVIPR
jgi:tungstate transport system ATP-binding protein